MTEDEAAALVAIAQKHRQPALRIEAGASAPVTRALEAGGWVELVRLRLDAATARGLRLPMAVELTLQVSADWFFEPVRVAQPETHRVDIRPSRATETSVSVLGAEASAHLTRSVPFAADLARAGVQIDRRDQAVLDDALQFQSPGHGAPMHQFLGFADAIQNDVWESIASDLTADGDLGRLAVLRSTDHRLLVQVDSDWDNDFLIGDLGRLYVLIPSDDLYRLRSDRTLAVIQMS